MLMRASDLDLENVWRQIIERQSVSGLSVKDFCDAEGLKDYSFWYWGRTLRKRDRLAKNQRTNKNRSTPVARFREKEIVLPKRKRSVVERRAKREQDFWVALLEEYRNSGLGMRPFAESKKVPYRTLLRWKRKLGAESNWPVVRAPRDLQPENNFAPVNLVSDRSFGADTGEPGRSIIEIVLKCGRLIRVSPNCTQEFLSAVIAAVEEK